jgi:hypothetical protein
MFGLMAIACIIFAMLIISNSHYELDKNSCESRGRFYWRGHCLPSECSVVRP